MIRQLPRWAQELKLPHDLLRPHDPPASPTLCSGAVSYEEWLEVLFRCAQMRYSRVQCGSPPLNQMSLAMAATAFIEHLTGSSSARYAEMDVLAAQVDTMVEAHARAGHSRSVLEADDALEIACSRLASLDLIERDGNVRGALAIQATATEGYLYSASSREAASKHAKDEAKLRSALGERSFPSGGRGAKGKAKGDRGPDRERGANGRGPQCYLCGNSHMIQDCPNLAAAQAAVRQ